LKKNKAIFLDRDGVINKVILKLGRPYAPLYLNKLKVLPFVKRSMHMLKDQGYLLIVITNQPDVARGRANFNEIELINKYLTKKLPIFKIFTCFHDKYHKCFCRKPSPGSILSAVSKYNINIKESYMVGDRWSDIEAGKKAGCKTIFIDCHYKERQPKFYDFKSKSLLGATKIIISNKKNAKY
jgi:D-glycero-D-manno-heptose 1,7-bisphosphate phosphatase